MIAKFEGAKEIKDYKPVSMEGCVYKVIAKIFTRRIRNMMGSLMGESQTASNT